MSAREDLLQGMGALRRQAARRSAARMVADTLMYSLCFNAGAVSLQEARIITWEGYAIYPLLVLLSLCVSGLMAIRGRRGFVEELIHVDLRLGLKEMLSSAFEYLKGERTSIIGERLVEDARRFLSRVEARELLPPALRRRHVSIPVLAILIPLTLTVDWAPDKSEHAGVSRVVLHGIAARIEGLEKGARRPAPGRPEEGKDDLSKRMEQLGRDLRDRPLNARKVLGALRDLLEEVHAGQARLAGRLVEDLSLQDLAGIPALEIRPEEGISPGSLQEVERFVSRAFEGDIPAEISEMLLELRRYHEIERFLAKSADEVASALGEETGGPPKADGPSGDTGEALQEPSGRPQGEAGDEGGADSRDHEPSYTAGTGEDPRQDGQAHEMSGSKDIPVRDPSVEGPGVSYRFLVRSLPVAGKARLRPEDLIRSYRREMEEVLTNDQMPVNYREYIKGYFLAIGMESEHGEDGSGQP